MRVLVPFDVRNPKTRLSDVLEESRRTEFARILLEDVLDVIQRAGHEPVVLATAEMTCQCPVHVDDRPLTEAVNAMVASADLPVGIVMSDLALLRVETLSQLVETGGDVVIAPGLGGGTNALVVRTSEFRVDYHGTSFRDHRTHAKEIDAEFTVFDSFRVTQDIDTPDDLIEVLLHNDRKPAAWLGQHGFSIDETNGTLLQSGESG
jgi:2-phospho-L-lactate guanylyltransferase